MELYTYSNSDSGAIYGDPLDTNVQNNTRTDIQIGYYHDYSKILVFTENPHDLMTKFNGNYENWVFNYCQEWGLTINDDVIKRVKKELKLKDLSSIIVTTSNNNPFDGNVESRLNMVAAIKASDILGITESEWKLADNTMPVINIVELKEALVLAMGEVKKILVKYA